MGVHKSIYFSVCVVSLILYGCATYDVDSRPNYTADTASYELALKDAVTAQPWEISNTLNPVSIDNQNLTWKRINGEDYLLVATWAGEDVSWARNSPDTGFFNTGPYDNWVTLVPDVKELCSKYSDSDRKLRLEQTLGLPENGNKAKFIEYWVKPNDLFRPCPDPEIHDTSCQLGFVSNTNAAHIAWYEKQLREGSDYPWTRLGYTYDWGASESNRLKDRVGLSEYVIGQNSYIQVNQIHATDDYCKL